MNITIKPDTIECSMLDVDLSVVYRPLYINIRSDRTRDGFLEDLKETHIIIEKIGLSGIIGPDIEINLGKVVEDIINNAVDASKEF